MRFNPEGGSGWGWALALDDAGNVYVTGTYSGENSRDYITIKYDSTGNEVWSARHNGPANDEDIAWGITLNWGLGMIDDDPLFVSFHGFDYLLRRNSPSIDAGDPSIEDGFDWPPRYPNGPRSDMGAYGGPDNASWLD